jgi:cell division protein FtsZ
LKEKNMSLNLRVPENIILKPCITVFGVGGAGANAVNNMISANLEGARFVVANTDAQALEYSLAERKIQLGETITRGLGAGASPDIGKASADEAMEQIMENLSGSNMVFITAGMGGGTGTGAAPVIAKVAKENGILTVGVVTKPFHFEGAHRMKIAELGLGELQKYVDTLIVIPNQNLFRLANDKTTFADAFKMADDVLHAGVRSVTDLMIMPGLINLDFADIRAVMSEMGKAMMGTGEATGDGRAIIAAEAAISNPLLDNCSMKGAKGVLINITGGPDMTLFEVDEAANRIRDEVDPNANIIFGSTFNPDLEGKIRVSVVATGIDNGLNDQKIAINKYTVNFSNPKPKEEKRFANISDSNQHYSEDTSNLKFNFNNGESGYNFDKNSDEIDEAEHNNYEQEQDESAYNLNIPLNEDIKPSKLSPSTHLTDKKEPAYKPLSLLDRMAYSVGLKSYSNEAEYNHKTQKDKVGESKDKDDDLDENSLDVPAFLRRRK